MQKFRYILLTSFIIMILVSNFGCDTNEVLTFESSGSLSMQFVLAEESIINVKERFPKTEQIFPDEFDANITITGDFEEISKTVTVHVTDSLNDIYEAQEAIEVPVEVDMEVTVTAEIGDQTWSGSAVVILYDDRPETYSIILSATSYTDFDLRTTLTWGAAPIDLDLHIETPSIGGSTHHIYFGNNGSFDTPPYVFLDIDDTSGFGPETITIVDQQIGTYYIYVHNFSGDIPLEGCGATIEVSDQFGLLETLVIPAIGFGDYWHLFTYEGDTGFLDIYNVISDIPLGP